VLFLAGLVYLGFLAYTGDTFQAEPFPGTGDLFLGFLLAGLAIAAVVAGVCASHQHHR
jgi:hypothetical protein